MENFEQYSGEKKPVKVATYNIHQGIGRDGLENVEKTAELIRNIDARVVGIQELGAFHGQSADLATYQIDRIVETTKMSVVTGPTIHHPHSTYGNCLLSKDPVTAVRRFNIGQKALEPRGLLDVDLTINGRLMRVMVTHLGLKAWERRLQVKKILNHLDEGPNIPTIIMGDFNEWFPWSRVIRWMNNRCGISSAPATFPAQFPILALDRLWAIPLCPLKNVRVYNNKISRLVSDHLPLVAEIEI